MTTYDEHTYLSGNLLSVPEFISTEDILYLFKCISIGRFLPTSGLVSAESLVLVGTCEVLLYCFPTLLYFSNN